MPACSRSCRPHYRPERLGPGSVNDYCAGNTRVLDCDRLPACQVGRGVATVVERLGAPIYEQTAVSETAP
ncbi:MAG: hypothetical protein J0I86_04635, partial [Mesorhizobium sp.]|nr:hypothetical protein [Mesorhizobium sp.]